MTGHHTLQLRPKGKLVRMEWDPTNNRHIEVVVTDDGLAWHLHDSVCLAAGTTLRDVLMLVRKDIDLFGAVTACDCLHELMGELGERAEPVAEITALELSWTATLDGAILDSSTEFCGYGGEGRAAIEFSPVGALADLPILLDTLTYAADLYKLGLYYRWATLVIENNGPGLAVISFLAEKFQYPQLFHDAANKSEELLQQGMDVGVNTNVRTKSMMISILQGVIKAKGQGKPSIVIRSKLLLEEMKAYVQEATPTSVRFKAAGTMNDDTVMGTVLAVYAARTYSVFDADRAREERRQHDQRADLEEHERRVSGSVLASKTSGLRWAKKR